MSPDDWVALNDIMANLAPYLGILIALFIVAPPDIRSRTERRRDRDRRRPRSTDAPDRWTCGRIPDEPERGRRP